MKHEVRPAIGGLRQSMSHTKVMKEYNNEMENNMIIPLKRGDIIIANLRGSEGVEKMNDEYLQGRLCVVVQNDKGNSVSPSTIVVPITDARQDRGLPVQVLVTGNDRGILHKDSVIDCGQIRTIDRGLRIKKRIGRLPNAAMKRVDEALQASLGLAFVDFQ